MVKRTKKLCSIDGCEGTVKARGWCSKHWQRWRRHGDPHIAGQVRYYSPEESFEARTEWQGDCLVWVGAKDDKGYGSMKDDGRTVPAHRYAWKLTHGSYPDEELDHRCWNRACVNVEHLRLSDRHRNTAYRSGPTVVSASGVRNVHVSPDGRWRVLVGKNGKYRHFGSYDTIEEAAVVAEQAREKVFGKFAGRG